ncbi:MAG: hypothetical protein IPJ79_07155 [Bacteroidetes bacterium]|nr:hypothetical protein [Bacteroidota bacterium]
MITSKFIGTKLRVKFLRLIRVAAWQYKEIKKRINIKQELLREQINMVRDNFEEVMIENIIAFLLPAVTGKF